MQHVTNQTLYEPPSKRVKNSKSSALAALSTVFKVETTSVAIVARNEADVARMIMKMRYAEWEYIGEYVKKLNTNTHYNAELMSNILTARGTWIEFPSFVANRDMQALATVINKHLIQRNRLSDIGRAFLMMSDIDVSYVADCLHLSLHARTADREWCRSRIDTDCMFSLPSRPVGLSLDLVSIVLSAVGFRMHHSLTDVSMVPDREDVEMACDQQYDVCIYIGHALDDCILPTIEPESEDSDVSTE